MDEEANHVKCFRCQICRFRINDLRYARTRLGIICASCQDVRSHKARALIERRRSKRHIQDDESKGDTINKVAAGAEESLGEVYRESE